MEHQTQYCIHIVDTHPSYLRAHGVIHHAAAIFIGFLKNFSIEFFYILDLLRLPNARRER